MMGHAESMLLLVQKVEPLVVVSAAENRAGALAGQLIDAVAGGAGNILDHAVLLLDGAEADLAKESAVTASFVRRTDV